jgi:hypothetical protein
MKYTLEEITQTVGKISNIEKSVRSEFNESDYALIENLRTVLDDQRCYLNELTYKDYNIENFNNLIKTIENNGLTNFNMSTFLSLFESENYLDQVNYVHELTRQELNCYVPSKTELFDKRTNKFNCDTVGCIAGFAAALAMNWETPDWLSGDSKDNHHHFEIIACTYLNIPVWVGKKIFYGDEYSAWAFAKYHSDFLGNAYSHLKVLSEYEDIDYDDLDWVDVEIELTSISYKDAVNLLSDISNGKIIFNNSAAGGIMLNPNLTSARSV